MGGINTYKYRILKTSWGIAIDIVGELQFVKRASAAGTSVTPNSLLLLRAPLTYTSQRQYIVDGIRLMSAALEEACPPGRISMVTINEVIYNPTDYQPDGLQWAVASWIADELGVAPPEVEVTYDPEHNRYSFNT